MTELASRREAAPLGTAEVVTTWWPLAVSWLLMALELTLVSSFVSRLPDPKINLAAYGGIVFPIALIIESPIIMLLAASTALSRDRASYLWLRSFMHRAGAALTLLHVLIAFTPLYDLVVVHLLHAPPEIRPAGRIGLGLLLPWTWAIAYRRFHQGVLIRQQRSRTVGLGTVVRLAANLAVLIAGSAHGGLSGVAVGTLAVAAGVTAEAIFIGLAVRPVLRGALAAMPAVDPPLDRHRFLAFYVPLALTSLLNLLQEPIGAAAMGRMPASLESLAAWPPLISLLFLTESMGTAFNEVVVALAGRRGASAALTAFARRLAAGVVGLLLVLAATPLSRWWFGGMVGLPPELTALARTGLGLGLALPALAVANSWYQGVLVHGHRTRAISESVALNLLVTVVVAGYGVASARFTGLPVMVVALAAGAAAQATWLRGRSAGERRRLLAGASPGA